MIGDVRRTMVCRELCQLVLLVTNDKLMKFVEHL
jgi:hypothetical protein